MTKIKILKIYNKYCIYKKYIIFIIFLLMIFVFLFGKVFFKSDLKVLVEMLEEKEYDGEREQKKTVAK